MAARGRKAGPYVYVVMNGDIPIYVGKGSRINEANREQYGISTVDFARIVEVARG